MLTRARLLSNGLILLAFILAVSVAALPLLQKASIKSAGQIISDWEYFVLQLPKQDLNSMFTTYFFAAVLVSMAYVLKALVVVAEAQLVDLNGES